MKGTTSDAPVTIRLATSIEAIGRQTWDACANPDADAPARPPSPAGAPSLPTLEDDEAGPAETGPDVDAQAYHPFVSYDFLHALEQSGSVGGRSGWTPLHISAEDEDGQVIGLMPAYAKSNSQGEYVFDWGWADAYQRAGGSYYPKLQVSVPFTPATGRRFLLRPGPTHDRARAALTAGVTAALEQFDGSSAHLTFIGREDWERLGHQGFLQRTDQQFHWTNEGYGSFDDFLTALASRKRKAIKRERRDALGEGLSIERLTGPAITAEAWDAFWTFYQDTGSRKWGRPYLTRRFYHAIAASMADRILLVMVRRAGRYVAGAINFIGSDTLYGRNWGCIEQHPFLHFEVCYYQAIDFAIERGLHRVEAGAQGEHKLARGYRPVTTYSAHYIADPRFRRAVADYLEREREQVAETHELLEEAAPFRKA